ncbi:MAG: adenylate/guanylate cyclase domain-containing protein [Desulfobacterales bacterium]|jgi:TolB-like protein
MPEDRARRKLSGILSADVVGYSRLLEEDEASTIRNLEESKRLMSELIGQFNGRVVDAVGDNLLAEFNSVVDATECAVKIQEDLNTRNAELPEDKRMEFRIGINLGDVIEDGGTIYGDGVIIAARLEKLARAGGICISGTVHEQIKNKLSLEYEYLGEKSVKNISFRIRAYLVLTGPSGVAPDKNRVLKLPDIPSIAVLPFVNMSDDPEQEFFSDGITEEIITGLSKIHGMFVIARNSTFTYKDKPVKVQQVSNNLGVRYVLEGSVRKAGSRVRITAQLVDGIDGHHLWAERYDRELKDIFALQDEITMKILMALQVELTVGEKAVVLGPNHVDVHGGMAHIYRFSGRFDEALGMIKKALRLQPNLSVNHIWFLMEISMCHYCLGSYEVAVSFAKQYRKVAEGLGHSETIWVYYLMLTLNYMRMGLEKEARHALAELLRLFPEFSLEWNRIYSIYKDPKYMESQQEDLRKAGLK